MDPSIKTVQQHLAAPEILSLRVKIIYYIKCISPTTKVYWTVENFIIFGTCSKYEIFNYNADWSKDFFGGGIIWTEIEPAVVQLQNGV